MIPAHPFKKCFETPLGKLHCINYIHHFMTLSWVSQPPDLSGNPDFENPKIRKSGFLKVVETKNKFFTKSRRLHSFR